MFCTANCARLLVYKLLGYIMECVIQRRFNKHTRVLSIDGTFAVWYHGTMSWMYYIAKFAWWYGMFQYKRSVKGPIRRTNIICNKLMYRPLESVRKYKPCGQTDRQTGRQTDLHLPIQRLSSTN